MEKVHPLEGHDERGMLSIDGLDLEFSVDVRWPDVCTNVGFAASDYPELSEFPGDKEVLFTGTEGAGYSVFLRQTDSELCLHIKGVFRCRDADATSEPIRLWAAKVLPCAPRMNTHRGTTSS